MEGKESRELEQRYQKLDSKKTLLMRLDETLPWEEFRPLLEQVHDKPRKSNAGPKPIDVIVLFKMLVLQQLYNISDEALEDQINVSRLAPESELTTNKNGGEPISDTTSLFFPFALSLRLPKT